MRADRALQKISRDEEQWARALFREKARMDYRSEMNAARRNGKAEGLAEGLALGEAKGKAEGLAEAKVKAQKALEDKDREIAELRRRLQEKEGL